jgi:hypothetical protein
VTYFKDRTDSMVEYDYVLSPASVSTGIDYVLDRWLLALVNAFEGESPTHIPRFAGGQIMIDFFGGEGDRTPVSYGDVRQDLGPGFIREDSGRVSKSWKCLDGAGCY